jgi:hypothetical protein
MAQSGPSPAATSKPSPAEQKRQQVIENESKTTLELLAAHSVAQKTARFYFGSDSSQVFTTGSEQFRYAASALEFEMKIADRLDQSFKNTPLYEAGIKVLIRNYKDSISGRRNKVNNSPSLSGAELSDLISVSKDPAAQALGNTVVSDENIVNLIKSDPILEAKVAAIFRDVVVAPATPSSQSPPTAATTQIVDTDSASRIVMYASAAKDALSNKSSTIAPAIRGLAEEQYKIIEKVAKALSDKKLNVDVVAPDFVKLKEGLNQLKDDSSSSPADLERSYNKLKTLASKAFKDDGAVALAIGTGEAALVRGLFKEISGAPASGVVNAGKEETPVPGTVRPKPQGQQNYRYNPQTTAQLQAAKEASGIFYAASEDLAMKFLLESGEYTTTLSKRTFKISPADSVEEVYKVIQDILSQEMFDSLLMAKGLARIDKKGNFSTPDEIGRASSYKNQVQRLIVLSRAYGAEVTSYARNGKFVEKMREAASGKDPTTLLKDSMFMAQVKALGATLADGLSFAAAVRADESGDKNLAQNASSAAISRLQQIINKNIPRGGLFGGFWGGFFGGGAGFYTPGIFNTGFMIRF